jgi:cob(I)alamin adenosyltransferase
MWKVENSHVEELERLCDKFGDSLPPLTSFILPGGSRFVGYLHLARTVARRAERNLVSLLSLLEEEKRNYEALKYLNRLSDLFFILCRWALLKENKVAPLWVQEKTRRAKVS